MDRKLKINRRLKEVAIIYLMFLMVAVRKHSIKEAAAFFGSSKSRFSKFLKNHTDLAVVKLDELSKQQAKQFGKNIRFMADGKLPWKIAILIDATLQNRSSLHSENVKRFNHGQGFVIGHQWTNIVLFINDTLIPLAPIVFYSRSYCRNHHLRYKTEHEHVIEYVEKLNLNDYVGKHDPRTVVVLADSGYDNKKIENAIVGKEWKFVIALKKARSVKTQKEYEETPKSDWRQVEKAFNNHRRVKWVTVYIFKNSPERKKRMEFRIRQIMGYLRHVGKAQLICSEYKKKPNGTRKYLASNDLKATPRQILTAYRIRWRIEIFHKMVKMLQGFEDVATKSFKSVISHVHWVYCAYIMLNSKLPGMPDSITSMTEKQRIIEQVIKKKKEAHYIQLLSQITGVERLKNELRKVLDSPLTLKSFAG
jgi:hypothetical protein